MLPAILPVLDSPPVRLRPFQLPDTELIISVAKDSLIPLITSVPASGSVADAHAYIDRQQRRLSTGAGYSFAVASIETGQAVGQIGVWLRDYDRGRVSIGYWIAARFRRRGFARAALRTASTWALTLAGVHRAELYVEPWNEGSWRTAEQVGYRREGLMRSWQSVGAERRDMYLYSLLGSPSS